MEKICGGMEVEIECGIHAMRLLWQQHDQEECWILLLIDARNAFNEDNWTTMMWCTQFKWPSGEYFTFNCYLHWATMVVRNVDGLGQFLHGKEDVTHGGRLAMITYNIWILPLIQEICVANPNIAQPWYADGSITGGTLRALYKHMTDMLGRGPPWGYFTETTKIILVVFPWNFQRAEAHSQRMVVRVVTRSCYLSGFIGDNESETEWLTEKVIGWTKSVEVLSGVVLRHPQTVYSSMQKYLQQDWAFFQHVTPHIGEELYPVEEALENSFFPDLFWWARAKVPTRRITHLPVKQLDMAIPNPNMLT